MSKPRKIKNWFKLACKAIDQMAEIQELLDFVNAALLEAKDLIITEQEENQKDREQWLADKMIKDLEQAGYDRDGMLEVLAMAREKYKALVAAKK